MLHYLLFLNIINSNHNNKISILNTSIVYIIIVMYTIIYVIIRV